jgi:uncharacterized membrane protein
MSRAWHKTTRLFPLWRKKVMDKKLYRFALAAALVGLFVSIYMAIYKLTENDAMCMGSSGCSSINASPYSELYGIPLGIVGAIGYSAILFMLWLEKRHPLGKQYGNILVMGMSFSGFIYSMYLMYLSQFVIRATCPFCVASAAAMTLCFIFTFTRFVRAEN